MTSTKAHILVVEDDEAMSSLLRDDLSRRGYAVQTADSVRRALQQLDDGHSFDVVVTDVRLGVQDGLELVEKLRERARDEGDAAPSIIVITAFGSLETAVRAFKAGAADFLTKPFEMRQLALAVERALEARRLKGEIRRLRREMGWRRKGEIVAHSAAMLSVLDVVNRSAETDATVLITGPSGTGKELVARALHDRSRRADGPFIAVNCAALPEQLLESELFGYRKGAFTDARSNKEGLFRSAEGGTLFLDELGEMPLSLQPKLLRVLQEREITPIGANRPEPIDVRVVAATNQDIETLVKERRFREDLFYRLNVIRVELPPLAVRPDDVLPMAELFLKQAGERLGRSLALGKAAQAALVAYTWPGNVRELQNAIERAATLCRGATIEVTDLPPAISRPTSSTLADTAIQRGLTLEQLSIEYCTAVVRFYGGNQSAAARHLGIDRKTLAKRLHLSEEGPDAVGT